MVKVKKIHLPKRPPPTGFGRIHVVMVDPERQQNLCILMLMIQEDTFGAMDDKQALAHAEGLMAKWVSPRCRVRYVYQGVIEP